MKSDPMQQTPSTLAVKVQATSQAHSQVHLTHRVDPDRIRGMFSRVAGRYDLANSILSLGIHHLWRKKLVRLSEVRPGQKILDCASGTGDLAIEFKRKTGPTGEVLGTDFCSDMLKTAPEKAKRLGLDVKFEQADVTQLQYGDNTFDVSSISFGIRNVSDPRQGILEMARVTVPGGLVMVLEFGQVRGSFLAPFYRIYSERILPLVGGWVTGQREAYSYLQKSSAQFPCGEDFLKLMESTGQFSKTECFPLSGGIAYIYKGRVLS
jgi:demethylmenaquinone methyltransferase/2-methoxy-6-polyprenyl-1,4-benzoquinol methylase